jgi:putative acetyltransferase
VHVRRELAADLPAVRSVHAAAFARGDEHAPAEPVEVGLLDALRADVGAWLPRLSLVAVCGEPAGVVIGHVLLSRAGLAHPDGGTAPVLALGPIGVLPEAQGVGVGSALVHAACAAADALDEPLVALLGAPGYYGRLGFGPAERFGVSPPAPAWGERFQARALSCYDPARHRGRFEYAAAFEGL